MTSAVEPANAADARGFDVTARRWPAYAIVVWVGLFGAIVTTLLVANHLVRGEPFNDTAAIVVLATALRALTVVFALASVQAWGRRIPPPVVTMALWGSAAAQLFYPVAETVVRMLVGVGVVDLGPSGLGDTSLTGWLHSSAVWALFGLPGALFLLAGLSQQRRFAVGSRWAWTGAVLGLLFFLMLGMIIG